MATPSASPLPVIVVNPASAGGQTRRRWAELEATVRRELGEVRTCFTDGSGHATVLAREALVGGAPLVVAVGGDGTLNEVVNGFFDGTRALAPDAVLGILPMGTGGDFIKTVNISKNPAEAARTLAHGSVRTIDVGRLHFTTHDGQPTLRHFLNITSFGIGGLVDRYVGSTTRVFGGKGAFFLATVRASLNYKNARCRLTLDNLPTEEHPIYSVAVANGRYFGGGMHIAPEAQLDDGQFDIVTIGDVTMATMMLHSQKVYRGTHTRLPFVRVARAARLVAEPSDAGAEVLLDVDGEAPGRLPATFELVPKALRVRV